MQVTSRKNPIVQTLRKAVSSGRPTPDGSFVIEGPHLVIEARRSSWNVEAVFATREGLQSSASLLSNLDAEITELSDRAFASVSDTETGQGIIALVRPRNYAWEDLLGARALLLVLDGIQDPGNAGTLLRSAEAFGVTGVILLTGTVRVSNGKLLRASAGSIFRVPFLEYIGRQDVVEKLRSASIPLFALTANGKTDLCRADLTPSFALVIGSEGSGVSPDLLAASETLRIPTVAIESLNAAIAGSIALFEAARQRSGK